MPFTFSHPAIVLPLLKNKSQRFSATGLIVGSMAPDFESFITLSDIKTNSHMWIGMFWFDLPLAFFTAVLFHAVVRDPLIENLPTPLAERFVKYHGFAWFAYLRTHWKIVVVSLLIGIFSHLAWDAVTHLNVLYVASVRSHIMFLGHRLYKELQFGFSIIGLIAIAWVVYKMPRTLVPVRNRMKYQYWLILFLLMVLCSALLFSQTVDLLDIHPLIFIYVPITSFLSGLIVVSIFYTLVLRREAY